MTATELLKLAIEAALKGGDEILRIYETDFLVETKSDNTPVTAADKASGKSIAEVLKRAGFPVISEEEQVPPYTERLHYNNVWIVDPLDGTKEYVKRNGEFAVNIALVNDKQSRLGVIYAPVLQQLYFAATGLGSFKLEGKDAILALLQLPGVELLSQSQQLPLTALPKNYTIIASRSHLSREVNERLERLRNLYGTVDILYVGSSIKQCWVAEGKAHEYPRYGLTMEWDTAAGQCILEEAGSQLIDLETEAPMRYNKEDLRNHFFIAKNGSSR